jgi:hypothetical protein
MAFKDQLSVDARNCVLNGNEFAEDVVYTPYSGQARTIKAIVERRRLIPSSQDANRVLTGTVEIHVARDAVFGVLSVNKGASADQVVLPEIIGGTGVTFFVADILAQDEGMWHLLLQK